MTHQATGTVTELTIRNLVSKAGKAFQKHGVKLDSGQEFEVDGFKQKYSVGQALINVGVAQKYKVWTETGSPAIGAPAMPGKAGGFATPPGAARETATSGGGFPLNKDSYQISIVRQNALTNMVNLVVGCIGAGGATTNVDEDMKEEMDKLQDLIIQGAYKFASFSSGHLDALAVERLTEEVRGKVAAIKAAGASH